MLNCHFCHGEADVEFFDPMKRPVEYFVLCRNHDCQARGPWRHTEQEAIEAWRVPELAEVSK